MESLIQPSGQVSLWNQPERSASHVLQPDRAFLSSLVPWPEEALRLPEIPNPVRRYLCRFGLPPSVTLYREPEEEKEDMGADVFSPDFLEKKVLCDMPLLVFGKYWGIQQVAVYNQNGQLLLPAGSKYDSGAEYCVHLETGEVWRFLDEDLPTFVNSSLAQFMASMGCWLSFYPRLDAILREKEAEGAAHYSFDHPEIYEPFLERMRRLDPKAVEGEFDYWPFMCDLSLY